MSSEAVIHEYTPTVGGLRLCPHPSIDRRILAANQSGASVTIKIQVTTLRLLVCLATASLSQNVEIRYGDLRAIEASSGWLDPNYGFSVHDKSGQLFHIGSSRPHVVAIDLWVNICLALIATLGSQGLIRDAISLILSYEITTLLTPDDYYSMRGDSIDLMTQSGFSFPINSCPRLDDTSILISQADSWFLRQQGSQPSQQNQSGTHETQHFANDISFESSTEPAIVYLPTLQLGSSYRLERWFVKGGDVVDFNQNICSVYCSSTNDFRLLAAPKRGVIDIIVAEDSSISVGQVLARISRSSDIVKSPLQSRALSSSVPNSSTVDVLKAGKLDITPGTIPVFAPSLAAIPRTFMSTGSVESDLEHAIASSPEYFQSFYNDRCPVTPGGVDDDVISAHGFDEGLYCALVREVHRYSQAQIMANQDEIAKNNAGLGAMVGSFLGLITGNIFAPFLGHTYGKNMTDRSKTIEEFLPDPNLLFNQDPNSFMSWSRGQVSAPRLRRLIFDRQTNECNEVFFRLVPAIVTADSVYPIQLFKLDSSTYFYRPFSAGIGDTEGRNQPNYDPIKVQRKYFHIRAEGITKPLEIFLKVYGRDIEDHNVRLHRFTGQSLDYIYADFKIQPGCVF